MLKFESFVNEQYEVDDKGIRKIAKSIGFPKADSSYGSIRWVKRGGHGGAKTVYRVINKAKSLGWVNKTPTKQNSSATGDTVLNHNNLYSEDGKYKLSFQLYYGVDASSNSYSLEITNNK